MIQKHQFLRQQYTEYIYIDNNSLNNKRSLAEDMNVTLI